MYRVRVIVERVEGYCALGYKVGDEFIVEGYYIPRGQNVRICLHALNSMLTILIPLLKGYSAREMGIGPCDDIAYVQCPDPGKPYTSGGTVLFKLIRERI